jgi:hypothetical protein
MVIDIKPKVTKPYLSPKEEGATKTIPMSLWKAVFSCHKMVKALHTLTCLLHTPVTFNFYNILYLWKISNCPLFNLILIKKN